ncbi:MAG: hypothetical protein IIC81_07665, partial [Chloroflexi bacterium]|nr:hypothetical protein [Chloroflexota bacterium]
MKVSCLQENLSAGLSDVGRAVASRTPLPITNNVLIATDNGRLKLSATNLELSITSWIGAKVEEEGVIAVPARLLTEFVSSLPSEQVEMSLPARSRSLNVKCARFEANISVRPEGSDKLGTKVEVKNLNSMKIVAKCIEYETERQIGEITSGGRVVQETRLWDETNHVTQSMRSKEEAQDYRYFPEPDLLEVVIDDEWIERVRAEIPELPEARRKRFIDEFGLSEYDAGVLTAEKALAGYYEAALAAHDNPKTIANWIMTEVLHNLKEGERELADFPVTPERLGGLIRLIDDNTISGKIAKGVFKDMLGGGGDPAEIVKKKGLAQISDTGAIEKIVDEVIAANPKSVEDFKGG